MATKKFKLCKTHIALILIIAIIAIFVFVMKPTAKIETQAPEVPTPIACTLEAKICPDGSSVSRNGSRNCEFNDCPAPEVTPNETKTVAYTFPSGVASSSLKITSLINTPTFPKVGETDLIRIYVKNVGSDSEATTATLKINSQTVATMDVPALERNAETVLKYNYTATATGDYTVEVNVAAVPGEEFIDDNYSKITITVY